jgi:hypothetical protein
MAIDPIVRRTSGFAGCEANRGGATGITAYSVI